MQMLGKQLCGRMGVFSHFASPEFAGPCVDLTSSSGRPLFFCESVVVESVQLWIP